MRDKLRHIRRNPDRFSKPFSFHLQLSRVFASLRDAHTHYTSPEPLDSAVALLPVQVRPYWTRDNGGRKRRFVIDEVYSNDARQLLGADVMEFDGRPILKAVRRVGQMSGCRRDDEDCVRRGAIGLTIRSLTSASVVQDPTVTMKVTDVSGNVRAVELEWMLDYNQPVTQPEDGSNLEPGEPDDDGGMNMSTSERSDEEDIEKEEGEKNAVNDSDADKADADPDVEEEIKASRASLKHFTERLETTLDLTNDRQHAAAAKLSNTIHTLSSPSYSAAALSVRSAFAASTSSTSSSSSFRSVIHQGGFPGNPFFAPQFKRERLKSSHRLLKATRITPNNGTAFGVLRVTSFAPGDRDAFLAEAGRLLSLLPSTGLVVDVRRNPGGFSSMTGGLFQLIFSKKSSGGGPALPYRYPLVMRASRFMLNVLGRSSSSALGTALRRLIGRHVETGAEFTGPWVNLPLGLSTSNNKMKKYKGDRVVILTDSMSFSAAELFTALVKDSEDIAEKRVVLGVDPSTNGAGATVNRLEDIAASVRKNSGDEEERRVFSNLPKGVDFTTATMRFFRAGNEAMGELIEHYGVPADVVYYENLLDVVFEDESLLSSVGQMLTEM